jgi:type II secretory pathway component PulF
MILFYVVLLSRFGKMFILKIIRKIKFIDSIFRVLLTYKFIISFEMLIGAGFTRNDALAEIARSLGSKDLSEKVLEMKRKMEDEGIPLAQVLSGSDLFSGGFSEWIGIAADSGNLHDELVKMESVYEELVAKKLEAVKAVVSPIMVVAMSVMVLLAFAALYGPIFGIVNSFMGGA